MRFRFLGIWMVGLCMALSIQASAQKGADKKAKDKKKKGGTTATLSPAQQQRAERLFLEAEKAKVIEDWEAAIQNYRDFLQLNPTNANAHFQLAQVYFQTNRLNEAEKEALAATRLDPENRWYAEMLATAYMNQGKSKEAGEVLKQLITKFPNDPDGYLNLAFLYARLGQLDNAIKVYDQFEKNFGIDENVIEEKKNLYLRQNKITEAIAEIRKLQEAYPGEISYLLMEADIYRATRQNEKAIAIYKKILETEPDNPQAQLGIAMLEKGSATKEQQSDNLKGIFENPKVNIDTKVSILLISYIQMNSEDSLKRQEAIELAKILLTVHPEESKAYAIAGDLYYIDKQDDVALGYYLKALEFNKDVLQVWQQVMLIYNQKRDWANVLKTATEAMELFPNQPIIYLFKGGAEMQLKEYEKAIKSFSKGEKMSADNNKLRAQFLANLGDANHSLEKHEESDSAYEKSLKLDPENAYVLNNYSYYLSLRKQNLERAKQMSAYANKLEPGNESFLDTYAWILFQMGDYKGAREWQEKAMAAGGNQSSTILEHYGDILFKLGQKAEAVKYWKQAKDLGSDSATLEQKIAQEKYIE